MGIVQALWAPLNWELGYFVMAALFVALLVYHRYYVVMHPAASARYIAWLIQELNSVRRERDNAVIEVQKWQSAYMRRPVDHWPDEDLYRW